MPGTALVMLSFLVTPTLFCGVSVSVSLIELLLVFVSLAAETVTVLVSEPVAEAMAGAMARVARSDFAVGITGVAGPGGGTPEKPVGRVAIAAAWARNGSIETRVRTFNFVGGREMIRFQASQAALDMVRRWMTE